MKSRLPSLEQLEPRELLDSSGIAAEVSDGSSIETQTITPTVQYEHLGGNRITVTYSDLPKDTAIWMVRAGDRKQWSNIWGWDLEEGSGQITLDLPKYHGAAELTPALSSEGTPLGPWEAFTMRGYTVTQSPSTEVVTISKLERTIEKEIATPLPEEAVDNVMQEFRMEEVTVIPELQYEQIDEHRLRVHYTNLPANKAIWMVRAGDHRQWSNIWGWDLEEGSGSIDIDPPHFRGRLELTIATAEDGVQLGPWISFEMSGQRISRAPAADAVSLDALTYTEERAVAVDQAIEALFAPDEADEAQETNHVTPSIQYGIEGQFLVARYTNMPENVGLWIVRAGERRPGSNLVDTILAPGSGVARIHLPYDKDRNAEIILRDLAGERFVGEYVPFSFSEHEVTTYPEEGTHRIEELDHEQIVSNKVSGMEMIGKLDTLPKISVTASGGTISLSYVNLPEGIEAEFVEQGRTSQGSLRRFILPAGSQTVTHTVPRMRGVVEIVLCDHKTGERFGERVSVEIKEHDVVSEVDAVIVADPEQKEDAPTAAVLRNKPFNAATDRPESVVVIEGLYPQLSDGFRDLLRMKIVKEAGLVPDVSARDIAAARNPDLFGAAAHLDNRRAEEKAEACAIKEPRNYAWCYDGTRSAQSDQMSSVANAIGIAEKIMGDAGLAAYDEYLRVRAGIDPIGEFDWVFHYLFRQKDAHIAHDFLPLPKEQGVRDRVIAAFDTLYTYNIELWKKQEVQRGNKDAKEVKVVTNADLELERAQEQAVLENNLRAISLRHKSDPVSQQFAITSYVHEHPSEFLAWAGIERDYSVDVREQAIAVLHHDPIVFARADATGRVLLAAGVSDWNIPIGDVSYFREHWDLHYKPGLSIDQILSLPPCPCTKDQIERIMREAPGLWNRDTPIILGYLSALFLHGGPYGYRSMPVGEAGQQCVYKWNGKLDETSTPDSVSPIIDSVRHLYDDVVPWFSLSHEEYYKRWIPNHQDNCSDIPPSKR